MPKELQTIDPTKLAEWRTLSGARSRTRISEIWLCNQKLDNAGEMSKDYGKLFTIDYVEDAESDNGFKEQIKEIDVNKARFFLTVNRILPKTRAMKEKKPLYWSREIADAWELVQLKSTGDNKTIAEGLYRDLKEKYELVWHEVPYVEYNGKIYRWPLSPAQRNSWWEVKKKLDRAAANGPHSFKISGMTEEKTEANMFYKVLHFEIADPYNIDEAIRYTKEIKSDLAAYYENVKRQELKKPIEEVEYSVDVVDESYGPTPFDQ